MEKPNEYQMLIYASFLHDIGKFSLRAGHKLNQANERDQYALQIYTRNTGSDTHPQYKYYHAALTDKFFREYLPRELDEAGHLAALHHIPENASNERQRLLATLITLADWLSSAERIELEEDTQTYSQKEPLLSIFSQLKMEALADTEDNVSRQDKSTSHNRDYYIQLLPLDEKMENLFPVREKEVAFCSKDYPGLWNDFIQELKKLSPDDTYFSQLYYLLLKYLIAIPSAAFREKPDLSLFHHLKSTSAIAACLYQVYQVKQSPVEEISSLLDQISKYNQAKEENRDLSAPELLRKADIILVAGDISGIQSFLYEVTSEKALKGLRARSFYIQLISEVLARAILKEFDLPETNLIYCGGGNFYLLIPALSDFEQRLRTVQKKFDTVLLEAHKGKLAVILAWKEISYLNFIENFSECWLALNSRLGEIKRRKFSSLFSSGNVQSVYSKIFGPFDLGGEKQGCNICGEELDNQENET
ncbi:MAG: type III-A CRISPR-associated protein Cas10/Csm1, partial [Candidatus Saccharicenans sp.]|nr:type III-A CRISPR-associated protein Cas10/Csm1 [Candidatus Saccharicenans sp.]